MLQEIFYWLFSMSIAASICGCAVLALGRIRQIPGRVMGLLWLIPLIRMWIPVGVGSRYGVMALLARYTTRTVTVYEYGNTTFTAMNHVMAANSYFPITYKVDLLEHVFAVGSVIWAVIAAALLIAYWILYATTAAQLKNARHMQDNVYLSDCIDTPAVYGILRPRILIPLQCAHRDMTFVLLHENAHIRRRDNLRRVIAFTTAALHWFNPFAWIFLKRYLADLERSCDETVLRDCGEEKKKEYAGALVEWAESHSVFASAFGGARIRMRIENILSYRELTLVSAIGFVLMITAIAFVLLTNAL